MLVDVVPMRSAGRRLPREQLRSHVPLRGELQIVMVRSFGQRSCLASLVRPGSIIDQLLPRLEQVQITRLSGESFVLVGIEDGGYRKVARPFRQSWWCRAVGSAPRAPTAASGP